MILRLFLLLLLVLNGNNVFSQKAPEDYMREAEDAHDSIALVNYMYIVQKHPTNKLCPDAYLNIARIYEKQGKEADAIAIHRKIIALAMAKKANGGDTHYTFTHDGNRSARFLCDFHEKMGNYDSAIYFLSIYDTVLPGNLGCGMGEQEGILIRYADFYAKGNRVRDAEAVLLSHSNVAYIEPRLKEKLTELFKKYEHPENLRTEIEKAVNNYSIDTIYREYDGRLDTSNYCCINFLGVKTGCHYRSLITGESSWGVGTPMPAMVGREKIIALLKKTALYLMIKEL